MSVSAFLLAAAAAVASPVAAAAPASLDEPSADCGNAATQTDMNICAAREYARADAELNRQWSATSVMMRQRDMAIDQSYDKRPSYHAQLLAAQRAWLRFRDEHCATVGYEARGGSLEPYLVAKCKTALTEQRSLQLHDLEIWLE